MTLIRSRKNLCPLHWWCGLIVFLNTLWECTGGKEDKENFIQKALKVCKVIKVKPLKTPKPNVPSRMTTYNLFCKDIWKTKKELQGVPVSKASAIISKEWKKVKASKRKKMKKYKDLYKEKQQHEEALQRYQEDYMDEMENISLNKRCNKKATQTLQPKKASSKSDEPKRASQSREFIDDPSQEGQKSKKADGKKVATRARKKVKKTSHPKKAPKSPEFIDSSKEEELPKDDIGPPLLGVKEKAQSFFDLPKDSKNLTIEKKVERVVFMRGPYKGYKLSSIALCDTEYLKKALKRSGLGKKTKELIKQALAKA